MRREQEAKMKMMRFHERNRVDELILPILSLELVKQFYEDDPHGKELGQIPMTFENHPEYMNSWMPLFLFETYNQMISQKGASLKEKEMAEQFGIKERKDRQFNFPVILEKNKVDFDYVHLRMFEADNVNGIDDPRGFSTFPMLQKLRENDLVLITEEPLLDADSKPVKKICNADFLMKMVKKEKEGIFLACVFHSRAKDSNFVDVRVDAGFVENYFTYNQIKLFNQQSRMYCYYFDSLTTIVREFLTIKKIEFYATHDIILNPVKALAQIESSKDQQDRDGQQDMMSFISRNGHTFNESQTQALQKVATLHKKDLLLIQGPPGTGKTHTIHGIISMINSCKKRKILVCAPSNAAIDEIVYRIIRDTFSTETKDAVLRVGAMDYEPQEEVKRHTLDYKLEVAIRQWQSGQDKNDLDKQHNSGNNATSPISPNSTPQQSKKQVQPSLNDTIALKIMPKEEQTKALASIKKAMAQLRYQEHTPQSMKELIWPIMKSESQFQHFLNVQTRVQKIDTLEKMRQNLEPNTSSLAGQSYRRNQYQPSNLKPISQKQRHGLML